MNTENHSSRPPDATACGPSLEYEPDYLLLLARLAPGVEVQYGDFVGSGDAPDWPAIEREARRLLARSQDIVLWACVCRAAVRLRHAAGLAGALAELYSVLSTWPDAVHPQAWADGEFDPVPRANALAMLCDPLGLLGDVRAMLALPVENEHRPALVEAAENWARIVDWADRQLQQEAPDLQPMSRLLDDFFIEQTADQAEGVIEMEPATETRAASLPNHSSRADMRAVLAQTRQWFEHHEPSSPVALLLLYAEHLVGKPFADLVDAIPADCLRKWQAVAGRVGAAA